MDIELKDLKVVHVVQRLAKARGYVDFYLTANKWKGDVKNAEPDKCDGLSLFETNELPKNIIDSAHQAIKHIEKGEIYSTYSEFKGWVAWRVKEICPAFRPEMNFTLQYPSVEFMVIYLCI